MPVGFGAPPHATPLPDEGVPGDLSSTVNANSATATADLTLTLSLVSSGNAASDAFASLTESLSGQGNASSAASADLYVELSLASSGNAAADASAVLSGGVEMASSGDSASVGTGQLDVDTGIEIGASSGNNASVGAGELNVEYALSATIDVSVTFSTGTITSEGGNVPIFASGGGSAWSAGGGDGMNRSRRLPSSRLIRKGETVGSQ
jgi:hypothetical protein